MTAIQPTVQVIVLTSFLDGHFGKQPFMCPPPPEEIYEKKILPPPPPEKTLLILERLLQYKNK